MIDGWDDSRPHDPERRDDGWPRPHVIPAFPGKCGTCSHKEWQHYRDRSGRPNCVGVCACAGFAPDTVDGSISRHPSSQGGAA